MIDIKLVIYIIVAILTVGGAVVTFFTMQTRQNMKIDQLQKDLTKLEKKQTESTGHQIQTEKDLIAINAKLDHIVVAIDEIKKSRGPD